MKEYTYRITVETVEYNEKTTISHELPLTGQSPRWKIAVAFRNVIEQTLGRPEEFLANVILAGDENDSDENIELLAAAQKLQAYWEEHDKEARENRKTTDDDGNDE